MRVPVSSLVLKYLARYLGGGPIDDSRIVSTDNSTVTILARSGETTGGDRKQHPLTIAQLEFTRRWCLHILPSGFTRTRRYGYWSNTRCQQSIERISIELEQSDLPLTADALEFGPFEETHDDSVYIDTDTNDSDGDAPACPPCPNCKTALIPHRILAKPSWSTVMSSSARPAWYLRL